MCIRDRPCATWKPATQPGSQSYCGSTFKKTPILWFGGRFTRSVHTRESCSKIERRAYDARGKHVTYGVGDPQHHTWGVKYICLAAGFVLHTTSTKGTNCRHNSCVHQNVWTFHRRGPSKLRNTSQTSIHRWSLSMHHYWKNQSSKSLI